MSGFVYVWYDTHHKMFYVGSHWGEENDGYICSSNWMKRAYKRRPQHFAYLSGKPRRKILARVYTTREDLLKTEQYFLNMIEEGEFGVRYYNLNPCSTGHWAAPEHSRLTVSEKISKSTKAFFDSPEGERMKEHLSSKFSGIPNHHLHRDLDPETKRLRTEKMRVAKTDKKVPKLSAAKTGKVNPKQAAKMVGRRWYHHSDGRTALVHPESAEGWIPGRKRRNS